MKKIILDTNFLLIPAQFRVDIFEEIRRIIDDKYELYIIDRTIDELNNIIDKQKGKDKAAAKMALELLKHYPVKDLKTSETERHLNVDKLIVNRVKADKYVIATQDMALKRELRQYDTPIIVLRQKKFLKLT